MAVRESILAGATEPEHRQVTVAFLHFMGVDDLLAKEGPEAVGRALSELVGQVQAAIDPRDVAFLATDVYDDGGKIILAAGAPTATGNDSERMLLALRDIVGQEHELPIRIGVNRGHVFAGDVGPSYRRTYTIMGDDVNLAARLMSAASPGEIYATPVVLDGSRTLFSTTALEPFSVKGKAEPVQAFEVGEESGTRSTRTREELPFTGRTDELTQLSEALENAQDWRRRGDRPHGRPGHRARPGCCRRRLRSNRTCPPSPSGPNRTELPPPTGRFAIPSAPSSASSETTKRRWPNNWSKRWAASTPI